MFESARLSKSKIIIQYEKYDIKKKIWNIKKAHVVHDLCGHPNTNECRRVHNSTQLGHGSKVGLRFLDSLSSGKALRRSLSVIVNLRLRLSGSKSVFNRLSVVDDLSGHPDVSWYVRLGDRLNVYVGFSDCVKLCDGGGDSLS